MPKYRNGYMLVVRWEEPPYQTIQYYRDYNDAYKEYTNCRYHKDYKDAYIAQYAVVFESNNLVLVRE